jgi:Xaa-Pro aminopeptidase
MEKLPSEYHNRVISAENLAIAWLETRSKPELQMYPHVCKIGHAILQEAFSSNVITPGKTTTDDVVWWLRQRVLELGLKTWFHPTVSIQRADKENFDHLRSFSKRPGERIIEHGDLLHVDFGITYLRLNTDQQQHFYVLKPDETEAPSYLKEAFARSNRVQDILTENFNIEKSGNQILLDALEQCEKEGIVASIYTHPIGFHGHAAGPTIGMWDQQSGVPGKGDYNLYYNTAYSIELNSSSEIEEWGKIIRIMLEEDGVFTEDGFHYLDGRQENIYTIPRSK